MSIPPTITAAGQRDWSQSLSAAPALPGTAVFTPTAHHPQQFCINEKLLIFMRICFIFAYLTFLGFLSHAINSLLATSILFSQLKSYRQNLLLAVQLGCKNLGFLNIPTKLFLRYYLKNQYRQSERKIKLHNTIAGS